MVCGIIIGVALCAIVMSCSKNNDTSVQTSSGKTASVTENSTKVSSKISEAESSNVEVTDNYTFDNSTKTLTVLSDAYFDSDYEKFKGTYNARLIR